MIHQENNQVKTSRGKQRKAEKDPPGGLAAQMPRPPVVNNGEVERPDPRLRAQVRHQQVMVAAATMAGSHSYAHSMNHMPFPNGSRAWGISITCTPARGSLWTSGSGGT